jgi:lysophospholipase L1-like esterase
MPLRKLGVYAAIVTSTIVAAEAAARIYGWAPRSDFLSAGDTLGDARYEYSPTGYGDLVPRQDGQWTIWFHRVYHVQTNSVGLRNTEEPSDLAFRVLAIGDSQTFGPYLANDDTWPAWAENYLRQRLGVDRVQVFNAGIAGYTIVDELAYLRDKGAGFKPGLVVLAVTERHLFVARSELAQRLRRSNRPPPGWIQVKLKGFAQESALIGLANEVRARVKMAAAGVNIRRGTEPATAPKPPEPDHDAIVARFGEVFRDIVALLRSHSIPFAVVFIPQVAAFESEQASETAPILHALCRETGTAYLDLTPAYRAHDDAPARFYLVQRDAKTGAYVGNHHLSREGNAVAGRAIADWLVGAGLVPRAAVESEVSR